MPYRTGVDGYRRHVVSRMTTLNCTLVAYFVCPARTVVRYNFMMSCFFLPRRAILQVRYTAVGFFGCPFASDADTKMVK